MAKICIDPGHYRKYNRCPAIPEYYESEMVWKLSHLQKKYLEELGHEVVLTRTDFNKDVPLVTRGQMSKGCDLFISNHSNATGNGMNEKVNYVAVYHLVGDNTVKCDDLSKDFADVIAPAVGEVMGISYKILSRKAESDRNKDGIKNDNYYGVLHGARLVETPGVIIEHGFHTNTACVRWLLDDTNLDHLARKEAECIDTFFKNHSSGSLEPEKPIEPQKPVQPIVPSKTIKVRVAITNLNIRKGPGTDFERVSYIDPGIYTITEIQNGYGSKNGWGKLKSGIGWISLDYVQTL